MANRDPAYHPLCQDELAKLVKTGRTFDAASFSPAVALDGLDLTDCRFNRCLFDLPAIRSTDFSGSQFTDCRFSPTRFANCKFPGVRFENSLLFDTEQKKGCIFAFCDVRAVEIVKSNFAASSFERCDLHDLDARECSFRGSRFHTSTFTKAISKRLVITKARFDTCNFAFADFSGVSLEGAEFLSCKFLDTAFFDANLAGAILRACSLDRVEWDRANLSAADLRGSTISNLNLAVLSAYAGLMIGESQQTGILEQLGIVVSPD